MIAARSVVGKMPPEGFPDKSSVVDVRVEAADEIEYLGKIYRWFPVGADVGDEWRPSTEFPDRVPYWHGAEVGFLYERPAAA